MYKITFIRSAEKEIEKLPTIVIKKISPVIDQLANEPRPKGSKKLKGKDEDLWRIRVGDYRVITVLRTSLKSLK